MKTLNRRGKAITFYKKAAELGDAPSQCNLAIKYFEGEGIKKDFAKGIYWMRKAAQKGDSKLSII